MFKRFILISIITLSTFFTILILDINNLTNQLCNNMLLTGEEICAMQTPFSKISINNTSSDTNQNTGLNIANSKIEIKALNLITVATYDVQISNDEIIVCGNTIGVSMSTDGVTIVGFSGVNSDSGIIYPFKNCDIKIGDRIKSINGFDISKIDDIDKSINDNKLESNDVDYSIIRNGKTIYGKVKPIFDISAKMYKLGLWIREDASGIGTLTFINPDNNRFGALGHGICENGSDEPLIIKTGTVHQCEVLGVNKGSKGNTGEIKGLFTPSASSEGTIDKNNKYGVYGYLKKGSQYISSNKIKIGGKLSVKPGKAKILCCIDGKSVKSYDIEIIKTSRQNKSNPKSLVIRVVDKELLNTTGGIIQGMSGSPIIQNNKLVGAITHVFVNDPTKGFGIYLDWMLEQ